MTPEEIERKRALGIPVHVEESDHDWRSDGYCNCGVQRRKTGRPIKLPGNGAGGRTRGKTNLDIAEGNGGWGDRF